MSTDTPANDNRDAASNDRVEAVINELQNLSDEEMRELTHNVVSADILVLERIPIGIRLTHEFWSSQGTVDEVTTAADVHAFLVDLDERGLAHLFTTRLMIMALECIPRELAVAWLHEQLLDDAAAIFDVEAKDAVNKLIDDVLGGEEKSA